LGGGKKTGAEMGEVEKVAEKKKALRKGFGRAKDFFSKSTLLKRERYKAAQRSQNLPFSQEKRSQKTEHESQSILMQDMWFWSL